ncbi:acyl dehydratase [Rhodobium orientis]|nr:MaoC family dehydratase [Rhodobium orientis]MBB4301195.1 acyl dehydratase [Rhodobium orientis]
MRRFEEIEIGLEMDLGRRTVTAEEIVAFAKKYDPQAFHLSDEAARKSHFGGLCASGWHTTALWIRAYVDYWVAEDARLHAAGIPVVAMGPSPGIEDLSWTKPVYAGDTLSLSSRIVDKRISRSRPDFGILTSENGAENQDGTPVMRFTGRIFLPLRPV